MTAAIVDPTKKREPRLWWFPSVEVLIFILVFSLSLFVMPQLINSDGDLGRHITIGKVLLDQRAILRTDIFSHTMPGEELVLHEWLSDLIFGIVYRTAGLNGIAWMTALILASTYALFTAGLKYVNVRTPVRLLAGLAAFIVSTIHWHTRPHIITTLVFTYFVITLAYYYKTEKWKILIPLPFLMILWANLHGAFISGLVLVGLFALGLLLEKRFFAAGTMGGLFLILILSSWINPYGPRMITHSFGYLQLDYLVDITEEYTSPNFHDFITWPFLGILLLTIVIGWYSTRPVGWVPLVMLFYWTASALYSARNIPLYGQIAVLFLACEGDRLIAKLSPKFDAYISRSDRAGRRAGGWIYAILLAGLFIFLEANGGTLDNAGLGNKFDPDYFPVGAIDALQESGLPKGNVFNEFMWGGYLLYRLWPEKQVFIDGQTDFYGEDLTYTYKQTVDGQGEWQAVLDEYGVTWVILPPERTLGKLLNLSPDWERIYSDETASVWVRHQ
jgi:hypothetical protein